MQSNYFKSVPLWYTVLHRPALDIESTQYHHFQTTIPFEAFEALGFRIRVVVEFYTKQSLRSQFDAVLQNQNNRWFLAHATSNSSIHTVVTCLAVHLTHPQQSRRQSFIDCLSTSRRNHPFSLAIAKHQSQILFLFRALL
jgi:hypothetical protein